eukprot:CAMPEP_0113593112 /NCGR_PEP_ID=MMETSP0015_2-20120614/38239_1 /TAXON_ID=2838 /ORGANISM="Odontella" /LENGTH=85 /DNA_ID=CAMNT_0000499759 /DNA_START=56 /DNA_END=309 /DNA_ORIENTATION=+ /assembly_acc=CAM_ASM_000160
MDFGSMLNDLKRNAAAASSSTGDGANRSSGGRPAKRSRDDSDSSSTSPSVRAEKSAASLRQRFPYPSSSPVRTVYLACPPDIRTG